MSRLGVALATPRSVFHDIAGHEELTENIIRCGIRVHEAFGPGLFESIYQTCFVIELKAAGLEVDTTRHIPLTYRGHELDAYFCPDIIVEDLVVVEVKAVEALTRVHKTQVVTYLRLTGMPIGILVNFNVDRLVDGVRRVVRPDLYLK